VVQGRVSAAAWSADGRHLVFGTTDETILYGLSFGSGCEAAVPVLDLSLLRLDEEDKELVGGGLVQDIQWDPSGQWVSYASQLLNLYFTDKQNVELFPPTIQKILQQ